MSRQHLFAYVPMILTLISLQGTYQVRVQFISIKGSHHTELTDSSCDDNLICIIQKEMILLISQKCEE